MALLAGRKSALRQSAVGSHAYGHRLGRRGAKARRRASCRSCAQTALVSGGLERGPKAKDALCFATQDTLTGREHALPLGRPFALGFAPEPQPRSIQRLSAHRGASMRFPKRRTGLSGLPIN